MAPGDRPDRYGEVWADVYDDEHAFMVPDDAQLDVLAELCGDGRALELGIGTGRVALPLQERGVAVEGIDASPSMVARLRAKPGGSDIPVVIGDMAAPDVDGPFRLVYVVFNTFFGMLSQEAQVTCFWRVATVLEPGGAFLLECFVPDVARFSGHQAFRTIGVSDDVVRVNASRHDPVAQQITAATIHITPSGSTMRPVRLRYAWPAELDLMAQVAGLRWRSRWSSWAGDDFGANSTTHISIYEKPIHRADERTP